MAGQDGHAPDARGALALVDQSEENTSLPVTEVIADTAYGDGRPRQAFVDSRRTLHNHVPKWPNRSRFPKQDFVIDLALLSYTCPADQVHTPCEDGAVIPMVRPAGTIASRLRSVMPVRSGHSVWRPSRDAVGL